MEIGIIDANLITKKRYKYLNFKYNGGSVNA